ncbi:MAG: hypothetical protein ACRD09_14100 [Vicinamibacterales bacterium]
MTTTTLLADSLLARCRERFSVEPLASFGVGGDRVGQHFDCDWPLEPRVDRAVDFAHAPGAEPGDDLVRPEAVARDGGHSYRSGRQSMPSSLGGAM